MTGKAVVFSEGELANVMRENLGFSSTADFDHLPKIAPPGATAARNVCGDLRGCRYADRTRVSRLRSREDSSSNFHFYLGKPF